MLSNDYPLIVGLEVEKAGAGDLDGEIKMLKAVIPERERLQAAYGEACGQKAALKQDIQGVTVDLARAKPVLMQKRVALWQERLDCAACNVRELALDLSKSGLEMAALMDTLDYAVEVLLPDAEDRELSANVDLLKMVALESALLAAESHSREMQRLEAAGVFEGGNRVAFASEKTVKIQEAAKEAHRQAGLAATALAESRAARILRTQRRVAGNQITRAEATVASIELSRNATKE